MILTDFGLFHVSFMPRLFLGTVNLVKMPLVILWPLICEKNLKMVKKHTGHVVKGLDYKFYFSLKFTFNCVIKAVEDPRNDHEPVCFNFYIVKI